jgi:hypothetical protein
MWDNHATLVATPYRNEPSHPSCQPVCYNDSPIATSGLWDNSPWSAQRRGSLLYTNGPWSASGISNPSLVFLHDQKSTSEPDRRELPTNVDPSGRNQVNEYIRIPIGSVTRSQPGLGTLHAPSLTHSSRRPQKLTTIGTDHRLRRQFTVQMTRGLNTMVNQPDF